MKTFKFNTSICTNTEQSILSERRKNETLDFRGRQRLPLSLLR